MCDGWTDTTDCAGHNKVIPKCLPNTKHATQRILRTNVFQSGNVALFHILPRHYAYIGYSL